MSSVCQTIIINVITSRFTQHVMLKPVLSTMLLGSLVSLYWSLARGTKQWNNFATPTRPKPLLLLNIDEVQVMVTVCQFI